MPFLSEVDVYKLGLVLIVFVGAIGLHVLVNWTGELSLGHGAAVGFPAFVVAKLSFDHELSPIALLPIGVAAGALLGAAVGVTALRAKGIQVALVTLAAAVAVDRYFFTKEWFVGPAAGARVATPSIGPLELRTSRSLFVVLVVVVALAVGAAWMLYHSRLGRGLLWVKADPAAAAAFGVPVARYRVLAYTISGAFAGLAGGLTAMWVQRLTAQAFPLTLSFSYLVIVALAGAGFLAGVAIAAGALEGGRQFLPGADALILYGAPIALILTLTRSPGGLNGLIARASTRLRRRRPDRAAVDAYAGHERGVERTHRRGAGAPAPGPILEVESARVRFGGVQALDGVSLSVVAGSVVGIIGPNGAGKTTLFDAITGLTRLDAGTIRFGERDVTRLPAAARAGRGMGRSFQSLGLMTDESATCNVMAAQFLSAGYANRDLAIRPWRWRAGERRIAARADGLLHGFGLNGNSAQPVGELSFATARFVELAAVLVEEPALVLLDEPTTGLDSADVDVLRGVVRELRAGGTTVVVIAHDVGFVMDCCDDVYVLAEGKVLAHDRPEVIQRHPAVVAAYLGAPA